jgi:hypothetical protein
MLAQEKMKHHQPEEIGPVMFFDFSKPGSTKR